MRTPRRHPPRGFTLIELLIVVAIIGIIASILIPNLLDALQRAKQKKTMNEIRGAGLAFMSWITDQSGGASAGQNKVWGVPSDMNELTIAQVSGYLSPTSTFFYIQSVPQVDAWFHPIRYGMSVTLAYRVVLIGSPGRDGAFTPGFLQDREIRPFVGTDYNQDILWSDGHFLTWPDAVQQQ